MIYVLYHSNCYDGFGSAYAAWEYFEYANTQAIYIPVSYGDQRPLLPNAEHIYILDFSYNEEDLVAFHNENNCQITLLDHHKTAQEKLEPLIGRYDWLSIEFDMNRSGALMSWEFFHPSDQVPELIQHISDRDLWKFELEGTKEVHMALVSYPMDFKLWSEFKVEDLIKEGKTLIRMYDNLVNNICSKATIKELAGYKIPVVNTSIAWSEVGNKLCNDYPQHDFAASFTVFGDQVMWSLRSIGDFDVSEIAKQFGGGGHKNAAGFKTPRY